MTAIEKKVLMARKRAERKAAGLQELTLPVNDKIRQDLIDYYNDLCDRFNIPAEHRPTFRK